MEYCVNKGITNTPTLHYSNTPLLQYSRKVGILKS